MSASVNKKKIIYSRERRVARAIGQIVVVLPALPARLFLIPGALIWFLAGHQRNIATVAANIMFTKGLALDAAHDMIKNDQGRQDVLARVDDKTTSILDSTREGIYSEKVRRKQMDEINLLLDHYLKLLNAEGKSYESLVKDAYQTRGNYEAFLHELYLVEKAVHQAALQTVGETEINAKIISEIEENLKGIRIKEVEKIFS